MRMRLRVRIPVRVRVCVVCVGYAKNDSLIFANGTEAIASANSTSVEQGWQSPFGDFRSPLTWTMAGLFGLSFFLAICGFIATKQVRASKRRRVRTMEKNSNKTQNEETILGVENLGCDVVVTNVQGPALLVSSRGNSPGIAKSAAGLKSIALASDAHLEEISTMTSVNAGLATINAPIRPSGISMAPIDAPEKLDKQSMALADNMMPDDAPMAPEVDEMPPPDYDSVVQINAGGNPGMYPHLPQS